MRSAITVVTDPKEKQSIHSRVTKPEVDYAELSRMIKNSEVGTILKFELPRGRNSNIKTALAKRYLGYKIHYALTYTRIDDTRGEYAIEVLKKKETF